MQNFDDVWFTFKARIAAELRLKNNDLHTQILLVWYAVASACAAIVALRYPHFAGEDTDIYATVLSVALVAVSMLVANRDYRGRALQMRANHIALKCFFEELGTGAISPAQKPRLYAKLLLDCENHSSYDDRFFRIVNRSGLTSRVPTWIDWLAMLTTLCLRVGGLAILYFVPLTALWM
jgi:hypothetical protein